MKNFFSKWSSQSAGMSQSLSSACNVAGIVAVDAEASVSTAVRVMAAQGTSAVLVKDAAMHGVSGIFTERDLCVQLCVFLSLCSFCLWGTLTFLDW